MMVIQTVTSLRLSEHFLTLKRDSLAGPGPTATVTGTAAQSEPETATSHPSSDSGPPTGDLPPVA